MNLPPDLSSARITRRESSSGPLQEDASQAYRFRCAFLTAVAFLNIHS